MTQKLSPVTVPDGYIHRDKLREERGWKTEWMFDLNHIIVDTGGRPNTSNKAYALADVQAYEKANPQVGKVVRKHMDAAASYVPPADGATYTHENTLGEAQLRARGWTPAHIARILHHHDLADPLAARTMRARYGTDRVQAAESSDERLQKSIAKKRAADLATYKEVVGQGHFVFRKHAGKWCAWGKEENIRMDGSILVQKKDGQVVTESRDRVLPDRENPGFVYLTLGEVNRVQRHYTESRVTRPLSTAAPARPRERMEFVSGECPWKVGDVVTSGGKEYKVKYINDYRITSDDPSVYGPHLLGYEGSWGYKAYAYPVAPSEAEVK